MSWLDRYNLLIFDNIDSTNIEAIRLIKNNVTGNFVIWAKNQTNGYGKFGREWHSLDGNLFLSILIQPKMELESFSQFSFVAALAVYSVMTEILKDTNINITLKWPNDVLVEGSKIAGILLESTQSPYSNSPHLVIGIGLNIKSAPKIPQKDITCLGDLGISEIEAKDIIGSIIESFDFYSDILYKKGFLHIRKSWLEKAHNLNSIITVESINNRLSGLYKDIDLRGAIRIQLACGRIASLNSGEIFC